MEGTSVMRGFTPRIINASSCAVSLGAAAGYTEINVKRRTYLFASHPLGVREVPLYRVIAVMAIEFINVLHKLLMRRVSAVETRCGAPLVLEKEKHLEINDISCQSRVSCSRVVNGISLLDN